MKYNTKIIQKSAKTTPFAGIFFHRGLFRQVQNRRAMRRNAWQTRQTGGIFICGHHQIALDDSVHRRSGVGRY